MRNNDFTSVKIVKVYIHSPCMLIDPMVYVSLLQKECIGFYVVTTCSNYSGLFVSEGSEIMSLLLMAISSLSNSHRSLIRQESGSIHIIFNAYRNSNSIRYIKNFVIFIILNFQSYQQTKYTQENS